MVEGRRAESWVHTSEHIALHMNIHRDPKKQKKGWTPEQVNRFLLQLKHEQGLPQADITALRGLM